MVSIWLKGHLCSHIFNISFQEVIQNAEDAGATKVTFLIDHTTYGKNAELLYDPHLADYQVGLLVLTASTVFTAKR